MEEIVAYMKAISRHFACSD